MIKWSTRIPWYITWPMRIVMWIVGLVLIALAYSFYAALRLGHHFETCLARTPATARTGKTLEYTRALAACIDDESGWIEKPLVYFQRKPFMALEPVPCRYVGRWKASREPNIVYDVTLRADRSFEAHPVTPREGDVYTGAWIPYSNRIAWAYEHLTVWPPDDNAVLDAGENGFTLLERDGKRTRYELVSRGDPGACTPDKP